MPSRPVNGVLEAWFRRGERGRWSIRLRANNVDRGEVLRDAAPSPDDLLPWIVTRDDAPDDLLAGTCRLRVRAHDLTPPGAALPPVLCWPRLLDHHGTHMLSRGWTLLHQTAVLPGDPEQHAWELTGRVTVLGDEHLKERLDALGVASLVHVPEARGVARGSIVLVSGNRDARALDELQKTFAAKECPLVVWCGAVVPPESAKLLEVVPTGEGHPASAPMERRLARFLPRLQAGEDAETALSRSLRDSPEGGLDAWMLRGVLRPWRLSASAKEWREKLRHWRREIDREKQTHRLKTLAEDLLTATDRRVQVTVVGGPGNAGLHYFHSRPVEPQPRGLSLSVQPLYREPPWAAVTAETLDTLCATTFGVADLDALTLKLRRTCTRGSMLLVRLNYPVVTLGDGAPGTVTLDSLRAWFASLGPLADGLHDTVRVLVNVYVVTATPKALDALKVLVEELARLMRPYARKLLPP